MRNVGTSKWLRFLGREGAEESTNDFVRIFRDPEERLFICILELSIRLKRGVLFSIKGQLQLQHDYPLLVEARTPWIHPKE